MRDGSEMDAIFERASVRRFTEEDVGDQAVERLLRAAMAAPSAGDQRPWEFYVVRDAGLRGRLAEASPFSRPAAAAPVVLVPCMRAEGVRFPECVEQDMSAATENLLLEAVEQGLGAVWMAVAPFADRQLRVARVLDLPEGLRAFALVAVGHPAGEVRPRGAERYDAARVHER